VLLTPAKKHNWKWETYMLKNNVTGRIYCNELEVKGYNKVFKVGFPYTNLEEVNRPNFCLRGILMPLTGRQNYYYDKENILRLLTWNTEGLTSTKEICLKAIIT
jgi:hypothetical protein